MQFIISAFSQPTMTNPKFKTIIISIANYNMLEDKRKKLELQTNKRWSYNQTIAQIFEIINSGK